MRNENCRVRFLGRLPRQSGEIRGQTEPPEVGLALGVGRDIQQTGPGGGGGGGGGGDNHKSLQWLICVAMT